MKKVLLNQITVSIFAAAIMVGCSSDKDTVKVTTPTPTPDPVSAEFQGNWVAPGYGLSFKMGKDSVEIYQYTSDYCFVLNTEDDIDTDDVKRLLRQTDKADQLEWFSGLGSDTFGPPGYFFDKVDTLPNACVTGAIVPGSAEALNFDATEYFHMYSQIFEEYYLDFDRNSVDWNQVAQNAGASLNADSSDAELFIAMATTLAPMADGHNYVAAPAGWMHNVETKQGFNERLIQEYADANGISYPIDEQLTQAQVDGITAYLAEHQQNQWQMVIDYAASDADVKYAADGKIRWFKNEGLGYLYIGAMNEYAENTDQDELTFARDTLSNLDAILDQALTELADVNGLVIDVRTNGGGFDYVSLAIASRFTQSEFHAYSKQARDGNAKTELLDIYLAPRSDINYHGPIVVLTSASTVSAAETFTMVMAELPQVTLVGEATHGAFSNILEWVLPNGFRVGLSNEYYLTPEGEWYEGTGIPVDVEVPFYAPAQREQEIDLGIETAIQVLSQ